MSAEAEQGAAGSRPSGRRAATLPELAWGPLAVAATLGAVGLVGLADG
jgi:hypothetical protein